MYRKKTSQKTAGTTPRRFQNKNVHHRDLDRGAVCRKVRNASRMKFKIQ